MMRAAALKAFGGPEVISVVADAAIPKLLSPHHVLLKVSATAINRADTMQRKGLYPAPPGASEILGLEACGVVHSVGESAKHFAVGDRAMALLSGGGYAEFVAVHEEHLLPLPEGLSFEEGAAIAEVFLTAWQCLRFNMDVKRGDLVLLHAGASAVGTAAAQLCRKVLGAKVITTSSEGKVKKCLEHADYAVSRTVDDESKTKFESKVRAALAGTDTPLVNAVIDPVFGGGYLEETVNVCANDASITVLAMMGGNTIDKFCATPLFRRRIKLVFSTLRSRDDAYKAALVRSFREEALPLFSPGVEAAKRLVPVIHATMPLEEAAKGHAMVDASETSGKVVLTL